VLQTMPSAESAEGEALLPAAQQMQLSARTYHHLLKVGRTIADLGGRIASRPLTWRRRYKFGRGRCRR